jgi:hypothetical protein
LGGVDGAGIAEAGGVLDVVGGQPDGEPAVVMSNSKVAVSADSGDGPAVAVFYPVVGAEAKSPVVAAGDDHVPGAGLVPVGQPDQCIRDVAVEAVVACAAVQLGHQFAGGGSMIASSPAARSAAQAVNASSVVVARSPTWIRPQFR